MNAGRRAFIAVSLELIEHCLDKGSMTEDAYVALGDAVKLMQKEEYWSLRNMTKHVDKNDSTRTQVAIAEVALPMLEKAVKAWEDEDLQSMATYLRKAAEAQPRPVRKKSKKDLAKPKR